jgi:ankyrin repeat protein
MKDKVNTDVKKEITNINKEKKNYIEIAKMLIEDITKTKDFNGIPALIWAVHSHNMFLLRLLIENGENVNVQDDFGNTPLIEAVIKGYEDVVELLIKSGADVNMKDKDGKSPLVWASILGHKEIVRLLIRNGAKDEPDKYGIKALDYVVEILDYYYLLEKQK